MLVRPAPPEVSKGEAAECQQRSTLRPFAASAPLLQPLPHPGAKCHPCILPPSVANDISPRFSTVPGYLRKQRHFGIRWVGAANRQSERPGCITGVGVDAREQKKADEIAKKTRRVVGVAEEGGIRMQALWLGVTSPSHHQPLKDAGIVQDHRAEEELPHVMEAEDVQHQPEGPGLRDLVQPRLQEEGGTARGEAEELGDRSVRQPRHHELTRLPGNRPPLGVPAIPRPGW